MPSIIKTLKRLCACDELVSRKRLKTLTRLPKQIRKKVSKLGLLEPTISLPQCVPKELCDSMGEREVHRILDNPARNQPAQSFPKCPLPSTPKSEAALRLSSCEEEEEEGVEESDDEEEFFGHNLDGSNASIRAKSSPLFERATENRPQSCDKSPRADTWKRNSIRHGSANSAEYRSKVIINSTCLSLSPMTFDEELAAFVLEEDIRSSAGLRSSWFIHS